MNTTKNNKRATGRPIDIDTARWSDDGGIHREVSCVQGSIYVDEPDVMLTNTELMQLRVRVIALENLMLALLAQVCEQPNTVAMRMAAHISPRPGSTPHRMTIHAAALMQHLGGRACEIRDQQKVTNSI